MAKTAPKFRTQFRPMLPKGETNDQPSKTVPDMSLSISEIMHKFTQGRPVSRSSNLHYTGDEYYPEMRSLDLVEQSEAIEMAREQTRKLEQTYNEKMDMRRKSMKEKKDRIQKLLDFEIQEKAAKLAADSSTDNT